MCLKVYKLQTALQLWFERVFSAWANIVSKHTLIVFIASSVILVTLSKFKVNILISELL